MSKGLEDFKELKKINCFYCQYHINEECVNDKCIWNNVEKELKVLEIIKEKKVDVGQLTICFSLKDYNKYIFDKFRLADDEIQERTLTQEEFDLLKEVLL